MSDSFEVRALRECASDSTSEWLTWLRRGAEGGTISIEMSRRCAMSPQFLVAYVDLVRDEKQPSDAAGEGENSTSTTGVPGAETICEVSARGCTCERGEAVEDP